MPTVNGDVYCIVFDENENIYIGGSFVSIGNYPIKNLAKLTTKGEIDTAFKPQPNGKIFKLALKKDVLICYGSFTEIAGTANHGFASINSKTGAYNNWNLQVNGHINVMKIAGDTLVFGGKFEKINGFISHNFGAANIFTGKVYQTMSFVNEENNENRAAICDLETGSDDLTAFGGYDITCYYSGCFVKYDQGFIPSKLFPQLVATGYSPKGLTGILSYKIDEKENFYLAGSFYVNNYPHLKNLVRISADGMVDTSFYVNSDTVITDFLFYNGNIIVAGGFVNKKDKEAYSLSVIDTSTMTRLNDTFKLKGAINKLFLRGDSLFFLGTNVNCFENGTRNFGCVNLNSKVTAYTPNTNHDRLKGKQYGDTLYLFNDIYKSNYGHHTGGVIKLNKYSGIQAKYPAIEKGGVNALVTDKDGNQYIAGKFEQVNGLPIKYLIKVDKNGNLDTNFKPAPDGLVEAICLDNNMLYVAGDFYSIGGRNISQFAKIDTKTGAASTWNYVSSKYSGTAMDYFSIVVSDTFLIVNMARSCVNCTFDPYIEAHHKNKSVTFGFIDKMKNCIVAVKDTLFFVANFVKYNGIDENRLGVWDIKTMQLIRTGQKTNYFGNKLILNDNFIYFSPNARFNRSNLKQDTAFNPKIVGSLQDYCIDSNSIYFIGTSITSINGTKHSGNMGCIDNSTAKKIDWETKPITNWSNIKCDKEGVYITGYGIFYDIKPIGGISKICLSNLELTPDFNENQKTFYEVSDMVKDGDKIIATGSYEVSSQIKGQGIMEINNSNGSLNSLLFSQTFFSNTIKMTDSLYITEYGIFNKFTKSLQKFPNYLRGEDKILSNNTFYSVKTVNYLGAYYYYSASNYATRTYKSRAMFDSLVSEYAQPLNYLYKYNKYQDGLHRYRLDSNKLYNLSNSSGFQFISFLQTPLLNEISKRIEFSDTVFDFEKHSDFLFCLGKKNNKVKPVKSNGLIILKNGVVDSLLTADNSLSPVSRFFPKKPNIIFFDARDSSTAIRKFVNGTNTSNSPDLKYFKGKGSCLTFDGDIFYHNNNWFTNKKETGRKGSYNYKLTKDLGNGNIMTNGHLNGLYTSKDNIIHVGNFTKVDNMDCQNIFLTDKTTGKIKTWNTKMNGKINTSFFYNGELFIAGSFDTINGEVRTNIAGFDELTGVLKPWKPLVDGEIKKIIVVGDKVFMHGNFANAGGKKSKHFAVLNTLNDQAANFDLDLNDTVDNFFIDNLELNIFGKFTKVNNLQRRGRISINLYDSLFTPKVISYTPEIGGNLGDISVKFFVFGILDGTVITLKKGSKTITMSQSSQIYLNGGKEIYGTFDLLNADTGFYDIILTLPNSNADKIIISKGFRVITGQNKDIVLDIVGFPNIRFNTPQTYMVSITNNSLNNKYGVPVYIAVDSTVKLNFSSNIYKIENKDSMALTGACDYMLSDSLFNDKFKCKIYCILLSKIKPVESNYFSMQLTTNSDLKLYAWTTSSPYISDIDKTFVTCLSNYSSKYLKQYPTVPCLTDNFHTLLVSFINNSKIPKNKYSLENSSLSDIKCDYLSLIQKSARCVTDSIKYVKNLTKSFFAGNSKPDCGNSFAPKSIVVKNLLMLGSLDPNVKTGPEGVNVGRYLDDKADFPYFIHYENNPDSATTAANSVRIIDTLDLNVFDLRSFRFRAMFFDKHYYEIPPELDSFTTIVDLRPEKPLLLKLTAKINKKGIICWDFVSLNPNNLLVNEDPSLGFLPPNKKAPEGEGGVLFSILLKDTLSGNRINNKAYIYFDNNKPVITPTFRNIIDNTPPVSRVLSLPQISPDGFQLNWTGNDSCAGVYNFDIYYSIGKKPFSLLLNKVKFNSFMFSGMEDSTYSFYSIATDSMGIVETKSPTIEAQTKIEKKTNGISKPGSDCIQLSPNPCIDYLNVKITSVFKPNKLIIQDIAGKLIKEIKVISSDFKIETKDLRSGVYFLNFISDQSSISMKIIKL